MHIKPSADQRVTLYNWEEKIEGGRNRGRDKGLSQNSQMSEPKNQTGHGREKGEEIEEVGKGRTRTEQC